MSEENYDVRVIEHLIRRNDLSQQQIEDHLQALSDDSELCEATETVFEPHYALRAQKIEAEEADAADEQEN